jgi:hypothetical protein
MIRWSTIAAFFLATTSLFVFGLNNTAYAYDPTDVYSQIVAIGNGFMGMGADVTRGVTQPVTVPIYQLPAPARVPANVQQPGPYQQLGPFQQPGPYVVQQQHNNGSAPQQGYISKNSVAYMQPPPPQPQVIFRAPVQNYYHAPVTGFLRPRR